MRILYSAGLDPSLPQGHAVHVRRLCEALERRGHLVRLVARPSRAGGDWSGPAAGMVRARGWPLPGLRQVTAELDTTRRLRREFASFRPQLLLARAEALTFAPRWARARGLPLVVECNSAPDAFFRAGGAAGWKTAMVRRTERALFRAADAIGAVTESLVERAAALHGVERDRLFLVPNGAWIPPLLGDETAALRRRHGVAEEAFLLAFAGNLHPVQGLDRFLEALARAVAPDATGAGTSLHLWIVGDSPERAGLERLSARLGLTSRVRFVGGLPEAEAVRHLQASQVVVAPYRPAALVAVGGHGLKLLQGLASDRPILVPRVPGLGAPAENPAVRMVDRDDPAAWAQALRELCAAWARAGRPLRDWPWPEGRGPGREWVCAHGTWDHSAAAWEPVFARALTSTARRPR